VDTTFAVRPDARLQLDGAFGEVRVRVWNRAEMQVRSGSGRASLGIRNTGDVVILTSRGGAGPTETLEIRVPATFSVTLQGGMIEADIEGVAGAIRVLNANGSIAVRDAGGSVHVETLNGSIALDDVRGAVDASATGHRISLSRVRGSVAARTVNGAITLRDATSASVTLSTLNGAIDYHGAIVDGGSYRFATHNGEITIAVAPSANATVQLSTLNGWLTADVPMTLQPGSADRRATYTIGNGSARMDVESFNGNIRLVRP
jgi:DUF4097 and DUF4098 domain-containing protein YvlB